MSLSAMGFHGEFFLSLAARVGMLVLFAQNVEHERRSGAA